VFSVPNSQSSIHGERPDFRMQDTKQKSKEVNEAWMALIRKVAANGPDELSEELVSVLEFLNLPLSCSLAVQKVLSEGNWSSAKHPRAYIRSASITQARKMHLSIPQRNDTLECGDPHLVFLGGDELDSATTPESIERAIEEDRLERGGPRAPRLKGRHFSLDQIDPSEEVLDREIEAAENRFAWTEDWWIEIPTPVSPSFNRTEFLRKHPGVGVIDGPIIKRDFTKIAKQAGLDSWESKVLEYRGEGVSRDWALSEQPNEASRKALQAAWRRFDRGGLKRLQEFVKKNQPKCPE
jgi:hypothetical protein